MNDEKVLINLNDASLEDLCTLPGISSVMAERIMAARPYKDLEDLQRVKGLGPVAMNRLAGMVTLPARAGETALPPNGELEPSEGLATFEEPVLPEEEEMSEEEYPPEPEPGEGGEAEIDEQPEEELPPEGGEPLEGEAETLEAVQPSEKVATSPADSVPSPAPARPAPRYVTRGGAFLLILVTGVLSFILSVLLTLGILSAMNGGLQFVTPAEIRSINSEINGLSTDIESIQGDLEGMRARMDNLEGLGGRIASVEQATTEMQTTLDQTASDLETLSGDVESLSTRVDDLENQTNVFSNFLEGMQGLLDNLLQP